MNFNVNFGQAGSAGPQNKAVTQDVAAIVSELRAGAVSDDAPMIRAAIPPDAIIRISARLVEQVLTAPSID